MTVGLILGGVSVFGTQETETEQPEVEKHHS